MSTVKCTQEQKAEELSGQVACTRPQPLWQCFLPWLAQSSRRAQTDSQGRNLAGGAKGELRYELSRATAQEPVQEHKATSGACGHVGDGEGRALTAQAFRAEGPQILHSQGIPNAGSIDSVLQSHLACTTPARIKKNEGVKTEPGEGARCSSLCCQDRKPKWVMVPSLWLVPHNICSHLTTP